MEIICNQTYLLNILSIIDEAINIPEYSPSCIRLRSDTEKPKHVIFDASNLHAYIKYRTDIFENVIFDGHDKLLLSLTRQDIVNLKKQTEKELSTIRLRQIDEEIVGIYEPHIKLPVAKWDDVTVLPEQNDKLLIDRNVRECIFRTLDQFNKLLGSESEYQLIRMRFGLLDMNRIAVIFETATDKVYFRKDILLPEGEYDDSILKVNCIIGKSLIKLWCNIFKLSSRVNIGYNKLVNIVTIRNEEISYTQKVTAAEYDPKLIINFNKALERASSVKAHYQIRPELFYRRFKSIIGPDDDCEIISLHPDTKDKGKCWLTSEGISRESLQLRINADDENAELVDVIVPGSIRLDIKTWRDFLETRLCISEGTIWISESDKIIICRNDAGDILMSSGVFQSDK